MDKKNFYSCILFYFKWGMINERLDFNISGRTVRCLSGKRCHLSSSTEDSSMSSISTSRSSSKASSSSVSVVVPSHRCRRLSAFSDRAAASGSSLASLPTVQCVTPASTSATTTVVADVRQGSRATTLDERVVGSGGGNNGGGNGGNGGGSRSHSGGNTCENRTIDNNNKNKGKCDRSTV